MRSLLTNDFRDILVVAKSISEMLDSTVAIYPRVEVKEEVVKITSCHLLVLPDVSSKVLEEKLVLADFLLMGSREDQGVRWDEWEREKVRISIGKSLS